MAVGLVVLLVQGCATVPHEGESALSLPGRASSPDEVTLISTHRSTSFSEYVGREDAEARRAEVEALRDSMADSTFSFRSFFVRDRSD